MSLLKKSILLSLCCAMMLPVLLFAGCSREEQEQSLSHKRLGIHLTTEKGDRIALTRALATCLQEYFPDTEMIPLTARNEAELDPGTIKPQVDYVLDAQLREIAIKFSAPGFNLSRTAKTDLKIQIGCYCQLTLGYRLSESGSGKTWFSGQSSGSSEKADRFRLKTGTVDLKIETDDEQSMIQDAMVNAVKNSRLSK